MLKQQSMADRLRARLLNGCSVYEVGLNQEGICDGHGCVGFDSLGGQREFFVMGHDLAGVRYRLYHGDGLVGATGRASGKTFYLELKRSTIGASHCCPESYAGRRSTEGAWAWHHISGLNDRCDENGGEGGMGGRNRESGGEDKARQRVEQHEGLLSRVRFPLSAFHCDWNRS